MIFNKTILQQVLKIMPDNKKYKSLFSCYITYCLLEFHVMVFSHTRLWGHPRLLHLKQGLKHELTVL